MAPNTPQRSAPTMAASEASAFPARAASSTSGKPPAKAAGLLLLDAVQMRPCAQVKCLPRNRRGRQKPFVETVLRHLFKRTPRFEHRRLSILAEEPQPSVRIDRRRGVLSADPLLPH